MAEKKEKKKGGKLKKIMLIVVALMVVGYFVGGQVPEQDTNSSGGSSTKPTKAPKVDNRPEGQKTLDGIVKKFQESYGKASNELKKSAERAKRAERVAAAFQGQAAFSGWVGKLDKMKTTSKGHAYITVKCGRFSLCTTNNEMSEALSDVKTLIKAGSPLFKKISEMEEGDRVRVSGKFIPDDEGKDHFSEMSLTEYGSMDEPNYIVAFTDVVKTN